ncbi:MAG: AAA family ATPase [Bacteroidales bacterium]|nr:AAA family ATPase [Bacteroidales bacterium]MBR3730813.1 AAA family ATPase [Bacteroidales bacterium]MBR6929684.1 AAA family ATPase [Bacteroidales bacterium]
MQNLIKTFRIQLEITPMDFFRSFHETINWENRLIGLLGPKGVGKSTLLLQHIRKTHPLDETLYVQADDFYFTTHRLFDLAYDFFALGGKYLYIDEIHKYKNWSTEIKQIYDQLPLLHVVYSGSSLLDLEKGGADLSRRTREYKMPGLSFREYLNLSLGWNLKSATLDEVLAGKVNFPYKEYRPLKYFKTYMKSGFYPFFGEPDYLPKLKRVVMTTVEEDIPRYAQMSISSREQLKKLMYVLAQSVPYKPNYSELERDLGIPRNSLPDYIAYLEKARLLSALRENTSGNGILRKIDKIYLDNPNMAFALSDTEPDIGNLRETLFIAWLKDLYPLTASPISDFEIDGRTFEVGGKKKGKKQIETASEGYIVKDDIEYAYQNIIPLWMFGFVY